MGDGRYVTIEEVGRAELRRRASRFLGTVAPVSDVATAEGARDEVAADHPDATHVVTAYRVHDRMLREYHADAGEPSGSAGRPILSVLRGEDLENVVAIVVRYFGGTELGIGGLSRAYRDATQAALSATQIVERAPTVELVVETGYDDSGTVRSILEGSPATFTAEYAERVSFGVEVPASRREALEERILSATSGRADLREPAGG